MSQNNNDDFVLIASLQPLLFIPMLWVYDHYDFFLLFQYRDRLYTYRRQILTYKGLRVAGSDRLVSEQR